MALLDFIKHHKAQQQTQAARGVETTRQAPASQDISKVVPASELAKAREAAEAIKRAGVEIGPGNNATNGSPNEAMLQKQDHQDKVQAAMSPTDRFAGRTVLQQKSRGWER